MFRREIEARKPYLLEDGRRHHVEEHVRSQWLRWQEASNRALAPFGVVYDDVLMLAIMAEIARHTLYPSQKRLAIELEISKVAVARSLARLEKRGYVRRRYSGCDRRVRRSRATLAGKALLLRCEELFAALRHEVFAPD